MPVARSLALFAASLAVSSLVACSSSEPPTYPNGAAPYGAATQTAAYPTATAAPPAYGTTAPAPTATATGALPGLSIPCQSDAACGLHRCNTTSQVCSFPCASALDCAAGSQCVVGVCLPGGG